jgi:hypothetical protein
MAILSCNARHFLPLAKAYAEAGHAHSGIILSAEQFSRQRFGVLLKAVLRLLNIMSADEMQICVVYLQQFE